ncbi:putative Protein FAM63A [Paratrimastix pyriformis]|uniref:MINDY deubiquitinase domain-containing protein n=1 Tax=Paratrimastix pyriformis TaxID=342808 RepID=A0ABQ8U632_9EUKA|nr:putative Protein FAM63A [Paratrimastix pyriformis]
MAGADPSDATYVDPNWGPLLTENLRDYHFYYKTIWIGSQSYIILTQASNGPCPLLALFNCLVLYRRQYINQGGTGYLDGWNLIRGVEHSLHHLNPPRSDPDEQANQEVILKESERCIVGLMEGMDLNVKFGGPLQVELTGAVQTFEMFQIQLCHGWLPDPASPKEAWIKTFSYNNHPPAAPSPKSDAAAPPTARQERAAAAQEFISSTQSQLTATGLAALRALPPQLYVLFRNNHFSTLSVWNGDVYQLVTDQGFLNLPRVVWERLTIDGDSQFFDGDYRPVEPAYFTYQDPLYYRTAPAPAAPAAPAPSALPNPAPAPAPAPVSAPTPGDVHPAAAPPPGGKPDQAPAGEAAAKPLAAGSPPPAAPEPTKEQREQEERDLAFARQLQAEMDAALALDIASQGYF